MDAFISKKRKRVCSFKIICLEGKNFAGKIIIVVMGIANVDNYDNTMRFINANHQDLNIGASYNGVNMVG